MGLFDSMVRGVPQDSRRGLWSQSWSDAARGLYRPGGGYDIGALASVLGQFMSNMYGGREYYLQEEEERRRQAEEDAYRAKQREREDVRWQHYLEGRGEAEEKADRKRFDSTMGGIEKRAQTEEARGGFLQELADFAKEDPIAAKRIKDLYDAGDESGAVAAYREAVTAEPEDPDRIQGYMSIRGEQGTHAVPYRVGEGGERMLDSSGSIRTAPPPQPSGSSERPVDFGAGALAAGKVDTEGVLAGVAHRVAKSMGLGVIGFDDEGNPQVEDEQGVVVLPEDPRYQAFRRATEEQAKGAVQEVRGLVAAKGEAENVYREATKKGVFGTATVEQQQEALSLIETDLSAGVPSGDLYGALTEGGVEALAALVRRAQGQGFADEPWNPRWQRP